MKSLKTQADGIKVVTQRHKLGYYGPNVCVP